MPTEAESTARARAAIPLPATEPSTARLLSRDQALDLAAAVALFIIVAGIAAIACGSADSSHVFVPASKHGLPGWMAGPLAHLGPQLVPRALGPIMIVMFAAYLAAYKLADRISQRVLIAVVVGVAVLMTLAPPLLSADVFGYIGYARLEVVHSLNPYMHGIQAAPHDAAFNFSIWHREETPYGPLFSVFSYALVPLGVAVNFWAFKAVALVACLGSAALVWIMAGTLKVDQRRALIFFALNPILLVSALGGAHNDLILMACVLMGFCWVLQNRNGAAATLLVAAVAIKVTAGMYLPFALIGARDKKRFAAFAVAAAAGAVLIGIVVLGGGPGAIASQILLQQKLVATGSVPMQLSLLLGYHHLPLVLRLTALVVLMTSFVALMVRAQRTGEWIAGAGWTALVLVLTTAWLVPWYILWALPIAAIAGSRRLIAATGAMTGYLILTYTVLPFFLHEVR